MKWAENKLNCFALAEPCSQKPNNFINSQHVTVKPLHNFQVLKNNGEILCPRKFYVSTIYHQMESKMNLKLNLFRNSVVDEINTESKRKEILTHERDSLNALIEQRTQCLKIPSEKMEEVSEIKSIFLNK